MKLFRIKIFVGIFILLLFLGFGYYYREDASRFLQGASKSITTLPKADNIFYCES